MDNVLIDDRRIHVDFSQSVAKLVYNKPGKHSPHRFPLDCKHDCEAIILLVSLKVRLACLFFDSWKN